MGTAATYEVETLGCALSFLYDEGVALNELVDAVALIPLGPSGSVSVEHRHLHLQLQRLAEFSSGLDGGGPSSY